MSGSAGRRPRGTRRGNLGVRPGAARRAVGLKLRGLLFHVEQRQSGPGPREEPAPCGRAASVSVREVFVGSDAARCRDRRGVTRRAGSRWPRYARMLHGQHDRPRTRPQRRTIGAYGHSAQLHRARHRGLGGCPGTQRAPRGQTETRPNGRMPIPFCVSNGQVHDHYGETSQGPDVALASLGVESVSAPLSAPVGCNRMTPWPRR